MHDKCSAFLETCNEAVGDDPLLQQIFEDHHEFLSDLFYVLGLDYDLVVALEAKRHDHPVLSKHVVELPLKERVKMVVTEIVQMKPNSFKAYYGKVLLYIKWVYGEFIVSNFYTIMLTICLL